MEDKIVLTPELIYGFTNSLLMKGFDNAVETPEFHKELWKLMCSDHPLVAAAAPRGHAKSTAITHAYTLANICFRTASLILIVSDTEGQAVNFLGDLKTEVQENQEMISLFNIDPKLRKDREQEFIIRFKDGHLCKVIAKGSEQKLRGLKWRGKRPDLIIGDDLENDEIVMNEERRVKFKHWFMAALLPAGAKHCKVRVVGTILHLDSLLEGLMPPLGDINTIEDGLKQYSRVERTWLSVRYKAHNEDFSKILWPEQWDRERLESFRKNYVEQGFPEGYAQEFLNYPIDESNAYFKKRDLRPIKVDDQPEEYYVSADLAISQKDTSAYTVFVVCGLTPDNRLRVRDVRRFRGDSLEIIDTMFQLQTQYKPEMFFVEQENIARALGSIINKEMEERGIYINIEPMTASQDKIKRARALQARMRAGRVEFDHDADWFPDMQQELIHFPRGKYMDQVDALSWIPLGLDKLYQVSTFEEMEEEKYQQEYEETSDMFMLGASEITGY